MSIIQQLVTGRVFDFGTLNSSGSGGGDFGFLNGSWGTLANPTIEAGRSIIQIADMNVGPSFKVAISGFGADPGQGYFKAITVNGLGTRLTSAAGAYGYAAGTATWTWVPVLGFALATPYTGLIIL